jgi:FKBP-type peptidyl-prolyl cis-trans isomerase 2
MVTLKYTMATHLPGGDVKDHPEQHIRFIFGLDCQVPSLEAALEGCAAGKRISLDIPASAI